MQKYISKYIYFECLFVFNFNQKFPIVRFKVEQNLYSFLNMDDYLNDKFHTHNEEKYSPKMFEEYRSHIHLEINPDRNVDTIRNRIVNDDLKRKGLRPGKDYRRTEEQVLDNRTKAILLKLLKSKVLEEINGCISTGKEGNVYIGIKGENAPKDWPNEFAVKIYKTCILKFKDRDRYVSGELRFQHKAGTRNSRKSVILWAEKEFRNLSRFYKQGIPSPRPLLVKSNIIFMELITQNNLPAPLLRDVRLQPEDYERLYIQVMYNMREIYHKCNLVHADLSEYNLLVRDKKAIFIDVGQAVEHDNVNSTIFLRNDISVITKFFQNVGVKTAPLMRSFEFVVEEELVTDEAWVLKEIRQMEEEMSVEEFVGVFIPQRLDQVTNPDIEVMDIEDGDYSSAALHGAYTGIVPSELAPYEGDFLDEIDFEEEDYSDDEEDVEFYDVDVKQIVRPSAMTNKNKNEAIPKAANKEDNKNDKSDKEHKTPDNNKEDINNDENIDEEEEEEEDEDEQGQEKSILKQSFDRKNFSKEEWKQIQKKLKVARREKRMTKTSKIVKRKKYRKSHPNAK